MTGNATHEFRFEYDPPAIRYGHGVVDDLGAELGQHGLERALVVTGGPVGNTDAVMAPVRADLEECLSGVFEETTPEKRLSTAVDSRAAVADVDAGCQVALGGGNSPDVAKTVAASRGRGVTPGDVGDAFGEMRTLTPLYDPLAIVALPTTLGSVDLS